MASAIISPISVSPFAETVPTWAISSSLVTFFDFDLSSSTTACTAISTPRFRSIGLAPAATDFAPSLTIACASTVAVVVPSPATSEVLLATSFTICAPMFSNLFSSSISLATVTPSLVMVGDPNDFSRTTLRPLGPRVTFTASASVLTPRRIASRARTSNTMSFAICLFSSLFVRESGSLLDDAEHVLLAEDEVVLALDLHLGACVLAEEDGVPGLDVERADLAVLEDLAVADGDDLALERLLLGGVGDDDPPLGLVLLGDALDDQPVLQRANLHVRSLVQRLGFRVWDWHSYCPSAKAQGARTITAEVEVSRHPDVRPSNRENSAFRDSQAGDPALSTRECQSRFWQRANGTASATPRNCWTRNVQGSAIVASLVTDGCRCGHVAEAVLQVAAGRGPGSDRAGRRRGHRVLPGQPSGRVRGRRPAVRPRRVGGRRGGAARSAVPPGAVRGARGADPHP